MNAPIPDLAHANRGVFGIDSESVSDEPLNADTVRNILESNTKTTSMERSRPDNFVVIDPVTRGIISQFERVVTSYGMSNDTKLSELAGSLRSVIRSYIESVARVGCINTDGDRLNEIADDVVSNVKVTLAEHDIFVAGVDSGEHDQDLFDMVKLKIDNTSMDGGLTRSELRREIGRNHVNYIKPIDEIIGQLIDSGMYAIRVGRVVAITGDSQFTERMIHQRTRRGRPRADKDTEIVRHVDGKLTDYIPIAPKIKPEDDGSK